MMMMRMMSLSSSSSCASVIANLPIITLAQMHILPIT